MNMPKYFKVEESKTDVRLIPIDDVAEVKHGKWILILKHYVAADGFTHRLYECDKCGRQIVGAEENYCPNCGASMRER